MANSDNCIRRDEFCKLLTDKLGADPNGPISFESVEDIYDLVFDLLANTIQADPTARVYLPRLGVVHTSEVPANTKQGLPPRWRYRLSCKAFPQ